MLNGAGILNYIKTPKWPSFVGKYSSTVEHVFFYTVTYLQGLAAWPAHIFKLSVTGISMAMFNSELLVYRPKGMFYAHQSQAIHAMAIQTCESLNSSLTDNGLMIIPQYIEVHNQTFAPGT